MVGTQRNDWPSGLRLVTDWVSTTKEANLLETIDTQTWDIGLRRRVQHYGYRYDYQARTIRPDARIGPLPSWLDDLTTRLVDARLVAERPDQVIVNDYEPGQGIAAHVDCIPCFSDTIASLSLGSHCVMRFTQTDAHFDLCLPRRSLLVLSGPARYEWTHAIAARKSDLKDGVRRPRGRRVSLTFRKVLLGA